MNLMTSKKRISSAVDIDAVLQDSYLLVVGLHQRAVAPDGPALLELCTGQIESVRQQLKKSGLSQRNVDHISHAQCALLDETVLSCTEGAVHTGWASEPLQARFFNRHQAGDALYEDMREVLREPAPDQHVLTVFQRVLALGFRGRYHAEDDPEREQLLMALNAQVEPLQLGHWVSTQVNLNRRMMFVRGLGTPLAHGLAVGLLILGAWWGLDLLLGSLIATLPPGQV